MLMLQAAAEFASHQIPMVKIFDEPVFYFFVHIHVYIKIAFKNANGFIMGILFSHFVFILFIFVR